MKQLIFVLCSLGMSCKYKLCFDHLTFKPLHQNLNSHFVSLYISYRRSWENLLKYQADSLCVIMSLILMTTRLNVTLLLRRENLNLMLITLGLKGLRKH